MQLRTVATLVGVAIIAATLARSTAARAAVPSVPASIAADCSRDVTSELNAWIRSVPDGSTLTFGAGACYRIDKTLDVVDRSGLTFDGNSSTFKATTQGDSGRAQWHAEGGGNLTFKAMTVQGVNTKGEWNSAYEWQHNFSIAGVQGMVLDSVTAKYSHGDWVAVNPDRRNEGTDPGRAIPGRNVRITNSSFINAGRQGISCTHCDGLTIEGNYLNGTGQSMFDLEVEGDRKSVV